MNFIDDSWVFDADKMVECKLKQADKLTAAETAYLDRFERLVKLWYSQIRTSAFDHKCQGKTAQEVMEQLNQDAERLDFIMEKMNVDSEQVLFILNWVQGVFVQDKTEAPPVKKSAKK